MAEDVTSPVYLTRQELGARRTRVLSGRGEFAPGYRLVGEGSFSPSESDLSVNIRKVVNPQGGQGPVENWQFYGRNDRTISVKTARVQLSVAPRQFGTANVVRPPRTAIRRMTGSGQGVVGYA